jgi:hypothetical protein
LHFFGTEYFLGYGIGLENDIAVQVRCIFSQGVFIGVKRRKRTGGTAIQPRLRAALVFLPNLAGLFTAQGAIFATYSRRPVLAEYGKCCQPD